jgi:iron(III) transport system permease protein
MKTAAANRIILALWLLATTAIAVFVPLASPNDREIAGRTFFLGMGAAAIAIPLGSCLAWVCLGRGWVSKLALASTLSLVIIPVFLQLSTWDAAFGRLGWLTSGNGQVLVPLVSGWTAAVWVHGVAAAPQIAILLLIGISTGNRTYEEQALLDTTRWGVFWNVTLPGLIPLLILATLWTIIVCSREIAATDLYQIGTLSEQIYLGFSLGQINALGGNWTTEQLTAAGELSVGLTICLIGWLAVTASFLFMKLTAVDSFSDHQQPVDRSSPKVSGFGCDQNESLALRHSTRAPVFDSPPRDVIGMLLLLTLVAIPLSNLIIRCCYFVRPRNGVPTAGYSFRQFGETMSRAVFDYTDELTWSLLIAVTSATIILILSTIITWSARRSLTWQMLFVISLAFACAIPGPLMAILITKLFSLLDFEIAHWLFDRTILAPVWANVWFCWPLASLVVWFAFRKIANDALEHAQLEGAGVSTQFFRFGLAGNPLAIAGCWLITFAFCFGELSASQLVLPPGIDTMPRLMLGLLHAGVDEMTAALTIVMVGIILILSLCGWGIIRLNQRQVVRQ